jgi:hypothetical protein
VLHFAPALQFVICDLSFLGYRLLAIGYSRSARNTRFEWSTFSSINGPSDRTSFRRASAEPIPPMFKDLSIRPVDDQVAENSGFIVYRNHEWTQQKDPLRLS